MRFAILASLVFHLLLLWPAPPRLPDKEAALLQATLRQPPPAPATPAPFPPPRAVAPAPTPLPRSSILATKRSDLPPPVPVPQVPAPAPAPAATLAPPPAAVAALPAAATTIAAPAAVSPSATLLTQANASGEALDGLRGYRLSVASEARRFKRYPPQAMTAGWKGTAEVRLEVGSDGRPRTATVGRSSGHEALDRAALTMIDAGALHAPLPESLRGRNFVVLLPVVFNLDD